MMDFMRKNSKTIMVFFGVLIMIGFVLPSAMFSGSGRNIQDKEVGSYAGADGVKTTLTTMDTGKAIAEIKAMLDLRVSAYLRSYGNASDNFKMINPAAILFTCHSIFGDTESAYYTRSILLQAVGLDHKNKAEYDAILAKIDKLIDTNQNPAIQYLALTAEANRNGFYATSEQVGELVSFIRVNMNQQGQKMSTSLSNYGLTVGSFSEAVGNIIAIASYVDNLTKVGITNENQLRDSIRNSIEINNISGKFVEFSSNMFAQKVGDPTEEELVAHFEKYKSIDPLDIRPDDKDNMFGFSYMLPDRIKVEYLNVDVSAIKQKITEEFEAQSLIKQEEALQDYWTNHKSERPFQKESQKDRNSPVEYTQLSFDESYDTVKNVYLMGKAREQAESVIAKIGEAVSNENDLVEANINWQEVAEKNSSDSIKIGHGESEFLSRETINSFEKFGSAKLTRFNDAPLSYMLFSSEPLRDRPATKLEQPAPLKLRETLSSIEARYDFPNGTYNLMNMYLVRIVAVDRSRVAASINDDGRQGGSDIEPLADDKNILKDKVKADLKKLKAYEMAKAKAEEFKAALAQPETDLAKAIETVGKTMMEKPDDENARNPLSESSVEKYYDNLSRIDFMIQNSYGSRENNERQKTLVRGNLRIILKALHDAEEGEKVLVENKNTTSVLVFDEFAIEPANQDEYADMKAYYAMQTLSSQQLLPMVDFFLHDNIIKRNDVTLINNEDEPKPVDTEKDNSDETKTE